MPNHCNNQMIIVGNSEEDIQRFKELTYLPYKNWNDQEAMGFSFDTVMPMPPELAITSGSSTNSAIAIIKAEQGDFSDIEEIKERAWVKTEFGDNVTNEQILEYLRAETDDEKMKMGHQALENLKKYGHKDWFSWCTSHNNWGTKWGAYELNEHEISPTELLIDYQTAWTPGSYAFFQKLAEMFPTLEITNHYLEEGEAFAGVYRIKNGEVEQEDLDANEVSREIFGFESWDEEYESDIEKCGDCGCVVDDGSEFCSACTDSRNKQAEEEKIRALLDEEKKNGFDREALAKTKIIPKDF